MQSTGAQCATDLEGRMWIKRQNDLCPFVPRKTCKELSKISTYLAAFFSSPLRWCRACDTQHLPYVLCLPEGVLPNDVAHMLMGFLNERIYFTYRAEHLFDLFAIWTYFGLEEDYVWPLLHQILDTSWARNTHCQETYLIPLMYLCTSTSQPILANYLLRWFTDALFMWPCDFNILTRTTPSEFVAFISQERNDFCLNYYIDSDDDWD